MWVGAYGLLMLVVVRGLGPLPPGSFDPHAPGPLDITCGGRVSQLGRPAADGCTCLYQHTWAPLQSSGAVLLLCSMTDYHCNASPTRAVGPLCTSACNLPLLLPGRAAQRLQELVRRDTGAAVQASTIHRLLRYRSKAVPKADAAAAAVAPDLSIMFEYGSGNKLPPANTLVDEVSMMDTPLASALFSALQ